jgi:hypothetical protein
MNHRDKYNFEWGNGLVEFNSLSPNQKYFYQIKKPTDIYWGLFVARFAFYSVNGKLIYYNNTYADPIHDPKSGKIRYASFSSDGNKAYFRERITLDSLYHVLLDLENSTFKRVKWTINDNVENLEINEFNNDSLVIFDNVNWNSFSISYIFRRNVFGRKLWFPG